MNGRDAGQPASPTLHPRTRPEASGIAKKHRGTGDWFRHDGKNVEKPPPGHIRLQGANAEEIATRLKGEPKSWYQHDPKNPTDPQPKPHLRTDTARRNMVKVYGHNGEDWANEEANQNYFDRPKSRLTGWGEARGYKDRANGSAGEWYGHDHPEGNPSRPNSRVKSQAAGEYAHRMRPTGTPNWFENDGRTRDDSKIPQKPNPRVKYEGGDFMERNQHGHVESWYGHDPNAESENMHQNPRINTREGQEIAVKNRGNASSWFGHDPGRPADEAKGPRCMDSNARENMQKGRGQVGKHLSQDSQYTPHVEQPRVKPEAQGAAIRNAGSMGKYLDQDGNKGYNSDRPAGRSVKPEAEAAFAKNKGMMNEMMEGYAAPVSKPLKAPGRAVRPEAAQIANRNRGTTGKVMAGELPPSHRGGSKQCQGAAADNAQRNKGSMNQCMSQYGQLAAEPQRGPKVNTDAAQENLRKSRGTFGALLHMES